LEIKKAVFPVGGLGTRFLPATKANPKEMLPIVDKPLIQYAVEEAISAGIEELIFVTSSSKRAIEDHFDSNIELESNLIEKKKFTFLKTVQEILPKTVSCAYIRQSEALGLGHAVLCAKHIVGNNPFAVLLADDLIDAPSGCLKQMCDARKKIGGSIIAVENIPPSSTKKYGVISSKKKENNLIYLMDGIVEKPEASLAPSLLGVVGRYILSPQIFSLLEHTNHDLGGEIQLTDAIDKLLQVEEVYGYAFSGKRYDCGSKLGYLEATISFGLKHPELSEDFKKVIKEYTEVYS